MAMSDDAVDVAGPWTVKSVPTQTRLAVIAAARKEGITVGQWLERRVAEWLADGSPTPVGAAPDASSHSLAELAQAMDAARALADAAGVKVPPALARESLALVRQATRAARGLPPLVPRPRALQAPSE
jgi:hypothetical protein